MPSQHVPETTLRTLGGPINDKMEWHVRHRRLQLTEALIACSVDRLGFEAQGSVKIDTTLLRRCIEALDRSLDGLSVTPPSDVLYDIYRAACVKEFELVLEQCGNLLRKRLASFFASNRQANALPFKDLFRHAAKHGLIEIAAAERWLSYRDSRNTTAHVHGARFAEATLNLLPGFIADARDLAEVIEAANDG